MILMDKAFEKALTDAYKILNYSARTKKQLHDKLSLKGHKEMTISSVIHYLEGERIMDDVLYAQHYIEGHIQRHGERRIRQALAQKGICEEDVSDAIRTFSDLENPDAIAYQLAEKKIKNASIDWTRLKEEYPYRCKIQKKLMFHLASRGFSSAVVYRVVSRILAENFVEEL